MTRLDDLLDFGQLFKAFHTIYAFSIYIVQTVYLSIEFECEKNENKQKRGRDWPILKKNMWEKNYFNWQSSLVDSSAPSSVQLLRSRGSNPMHTSYTFSVLFDQYYYL